MNASSSSLPTKLAAISLILAFLSIATLGSGCITLGASAAEIDPLEIKASPYFRDVVFVTDEPSYLQRFDGLGRWKVSVGTPSISVADSALTITSPSATAVRLTLPEYDAPGINPEGRAYIETRIKASDVSTQKTSFTLANVATGQIAAASLSDGKLTYSYSTASSVATGTIYSPISADTYYRVSIELTATGLTYNILATDGTLLGNYYANNAVLNAGEVNEIHLGIEGKAGTATVDYLYVTDTTPLSASSDVYGGMNVMIADDSRVQGGVRLDRQSLDLARSGSEVVQAANGIPALDLSKGEYSREDIINLYGAMPEPNQRTEGTMVAKGWTDFRGDMESSLRESLAKPLGLQASNVHLVDYYVDYIQLSTEVDKKVVEAQYDRLWESLQSALIATIGDEDVNVRPPTQFYMTIDSARNTMVINFGSGEMSALEDFWNSDLSWFAFPAAKGAEAAVRFVCEQTFGKMVPDIPSPQDIQEALTAAYDTVKDRFDNETARWWAVLNATTEKYLGMAQASMTAAYTWATGTVNNITAAMTDSITSIADMNKQFMSWSQTQMENTNAMFAQMFMQMSESMEETQRYFADQQAKANQAITNITAELANSKVVMDNMWADFLAGGKPTSDSPLTMSAFFGDELVQSIVVVVVVAAIIVIIALALVMFSGKKRSGTRRQ